MSETWLVIVGLAALTFLIRFCGWALGQRLPQTGFWARFLSALPGCLIVALVALFIVKGKSAELIASSIAIAVALMTRSLPATMAIGIVAIWALRTYA